MKSLNKKNIIKYLGEISSWKLNHNTKKISKEFEFENFLEAMNFVKKVAKIAEAEKHHPDIHIFYNKVLIELTTHSANGLSFKDFLMASQIDGIR
jgi:4a-hydroxytetrahydrobiopterin dehydratase